MARGGPVTPLRSLAGALCAPSATVLLALRRPALVAVIVGAAMAIGATGHVTLSLWASTTACWSFAAGIQLAVALAVIGVPARRVTGVARGLDRDRYRIDLIRSYERARTLRPSVAAIGSTDFHFWQPVGLCRTYLFVKSVDRDGVLDAIRAGRTVACDATGAVYGPAGLAAEAASLCAADTAAAAQANHRVEKVAALVALAALAAIVLF